MFRIGVQSEIGQITKLFHSFGWWNTQNDKNSMNKKKWLFLGFFVTVPISFGVGAIYCENFDESVFLYVISLTMAVLTHRFYYITKIWPKVHRYISRLGTHSTGDLEGYSGVRNKLNFFRKFILCLCGAIAAADVLIIISPLFGAEKSLVLNIGFPLDWRNNDVAYWLAQTYLTAAAILTLPIWLSTVLQWYLLLNCSLKYELLCCRFKNINQPITRSKKPFTNDLIVGIREHQNVKRMIEQFNETFSSLFLTQILTSSLCITGSSFAIAFSSFDDIIFVGINAVLLIYGFFDIFMIMYFGNEIKVTSGLLSYSLFKSNWITLSMSQKKCFVIVVELLKRPHILRVGILYSLDLETFMSILNGAYSMFNILCRLR